MNPDHVSKLLDAIASTPLGAPPTRPAWCPVCGAAVPFRGEVCPGCVPSARVSNRLRALARAEATIPKKYQGARFDDPRVKAEWVTHAPSILEAHGAVVRGVRRVMLFGGAGVGKTTLAACMAREVIDRGLSADASPEAWETAKGLRWFSSYAISKSRVNMPLGTGDPKEVTEAVGATVLVIDDLGAEPKIHNSAIPEILFERDQNDDGITIVTTGYTIEQLDQRYGDGIARRLLEGALEIAPAGPRRATNPTGTLPGVS